MRKKITDSTSTCFNGTKSISDGGKACDQNEGKGESKSINKLPIKKNHKKMLDLSSKNSLF